MDVTLYFEKGSEQNYSCFVEQELPGYSLIGYGRDAEEAEKDLFVSLEEIRELREAEGKETPDINVVDRHFDTPSLFSYYPVTIAALARNTGLNASLLRQYACGKRTPGEKNRARIIEGYHRIGQQLVKATESLVTRNG